MDASGQEDQGADVTLFAQCSLKVDPSSLALKFHFNGHGVKSAQGAVSSTVDLGGASKKLSILDQAHGVGHHPDVLGGNRRVGTGLQNSRVPDADVKVVSQGASVGNRRLTQVGTKDDRRLVGPLQRRPKL